MFYLKFLPRTDYSKDEKPRWAGLPGPLASSVLGILHQSRCDHTW